MELILKDATYKSIKKDNNLCNLNYTFKEGVTFMYGLSGSCLKHLLYQEYKCQSGYVMVNKKATQKDFGYVGLKNYKDFKTDIVCNEMNYINDYYHLNYKNINKRIDNALTLVGLSIKYHNAEFKNLSLGELKKIQLACVLFMNPKIIVFDYYDKNMPNKDIEYLNKLINKLVKMYNKNIIICSDNISLYLNSINRIIVFKNGSLMFNGKISDIYNDELYKYIEMPKIIEFIKYLNNQGHSMDKYIDIKELLKAIYRDVENK